MTLDERKKKILESVIKDYVETAEPVGSRAIVKKHNLRISAATVRNEMADLEDMGYLQQPHTSAGRIPSESGFRYYVDCMMERENLVDDEVQLLQKIIKENLQDWDEVIQSIGNFLAQVTRYTSFVIVPTVRVDEFKYVQLVLMGKGKAMVILVTDTGVLMHRRISIPESVEQKDLQSINEVFNRIFAGKKFAEVRKTDLQYLRDELHKSKRIIDTILEAIDRLAESAGEDKVVISGILNMLNEPEFKNLDKLKKILAILEEETLLKNLLPEPSCDEVEITIGRENRLDEAKEMSIVLAGYKIFGEVGRVGVIGPVRMEYWKAAGTVDSVRTAIDEVLKKHF
ncbi:MAG: heat-inducible transcription repressor HrcA [Syntrophomonadaceae bacterium]|jgi:heat-inducible transcriptional repressor|nr:heat-inducible transcription repressor HrcA [Syntrophomonadaceae bacterium]